MAIYTEGVVGDGAAILKDGRPVTIDEVLTTLNAHDRMCRKIDEAYADHMEIKRNTLGATIEATKEP